MTLSIISGLTPSIARGIVTSMSNVEKIRENRLRRAAERQGLNLSKSRLRDPRAVGYGLYTLSDKQTGGVLVSTQSSAGMSLDEVEDRLNN
jgi:hypothetical protein